jgi:hypothetical protein
VYLELREKANEDPTFMYSITLFSNLKMKLKGRHFETVWHPKKLQVVLNSIKENYFHGTFEAWFSVCVPKQTSLKEMKAKIE